MKFDLRASRRLHLKRPAPAMVLGGRVDIRDLGLRSVGVEHELELPEGLRTFLEFVWAGTPMRLNCVVASTRPVKARPGWSRSGLTIERNSESRDEYVRRVSEALEQLRAAEAKLPPVV